jgi:hypothetical protein
MLIIAFSLAFIRYFGFFYNVVPPPTYTIRKLGKYDYGHMIRYD